MISAIKKTILGFSKTRAKIKNIFSMLSKKSSLNQSDIEQLEEILLNADLGWELTDVIIESMQSQNVADMALEENFYQTIKNHLADTGKKRPLNKIILLVGVNGTGKTTSAAKLGGYYAKNGEKVSLVAADTYRAAAIEQIQIWSKRLNLHLIANEQSSEPASVAYDGVSNGIAKRYDRIIIDTSGRVHNSPGLMKELKKIYEVVKKISTEVDVLMTLDANTGQNGMQQAREFSNYIPLTGFILTKMDGTARGGILVQIMKELNLPVYFMGVGEQVDDLVPFNQEDYINALISDKEEVVNG